MVKEIKAFDNSIWHGVDKFTWTTANDLATELSTELYRAATEGVRFDASVQPRTPTLQDIVSCDRERLARCNNPHGLCYHWNATPESGNAVYMCHGQEIWIAWWHLESNPDPLCIEVRMKNPTLETFLAIDPEKRRMMRFYSTSGSRVDVNTSI